MAIDASTLRKKAKLRGLTTKVKHGLILFFDEETQVFGPGTEENAKAFLRRVLPLSRSKPRVAPKPAPIKAAHVRLAVGPKDYAQARKVGDYKMKVKDGKIFLWAGDELVFESSDVGRFRRFLASARMGLVPRGPAIIEKQKRALERMAEHARRMEERTRRAEERRKEERLRAATMPMKSALKKDDRGLASEDHTPSDYRGMILTPVTLPAGVSAEVGLVSMWAEEDKDPYRQAPTISRNLDAAQAAVAGNVATTEVWLSDADRRSISRYQRDPSVVLMAAVLARRGVSATR